MIDNVLLLILVLSISYVFLMVIPLGIAYYYEKLFKKRVYPHLFIISCVLVIISFIILYYDSASNIESGFFALGGVLIAATSIKLYIVMTGGD
ncbi:MAG: hypothetical protein PHU34_09455 [Candidatus Methanoperedens sp.]|nr:hypothetical protein [Candidatus Methanoperedens sp.]